MFIGAGEALVLAALVGLFSWLLRPLPGGLEVSIARRLAPQLGGRGRVVVLERRRDGSFTREDRHDG